MVGTDSERGETECKGHMTHTLPQETPSLPSPETVMYCLQQYIDAKTKPAVISGYLPGHPGAFGCGFSRCRGR